MFDVLIFGLVFLLLLETFTDYRVAFGCFWTLSTQDSNHTCHCRACGPIVVPWCINMGAAFPFHKWFDLMKIQVGSKTAVFIKRLWHGVSVQALTFFSFTRTHKHTVSLVKVLWLFDPSIGPNLHSAQTFSLCVRGHLKTVYARPRLCHAKLDFVKLYYLYADGISRFLSSFSWPHIKTLKKYKNIPEKDDSDTWAVGVE